MHHTDQMSKSIEGFVRWGHLVKAVAATVLWCNGFFLLCWNLCFSSLIVLNAWAVSNYFLISTNLFINFCCQQNWTYLMFVFWILFFLSEFSLSVLFVSSGFHYRLINVCLSINSIDLLLVVSLSSHFAKLDFASCRLLWFRRIDKDWVMKYWKLYLGLFGDVQWMTDFIGWRGEIPDVFW